MKLKIGILILAIAVLAVFVNAKTYSDDRFLTYVVDLKKQDLKLFYKNEKGENFGSIQNLKNWIENHHLKLEFAMNGGMYKKDNSPQGLYIEKQKELFPLDTAEAQGNFYLKPNGVFYLTTGNSAKICTTEKFANNGKITYATQSGPMLVIDNQIHSAFKEGSPNLNIRNGVGILPDGKVLFVMSKTEVNFYDFAKYFKDAGCRNALYLDGFVSRAYVPSEKWIQTDGKFWCVICSNIKKIKPDEKRKYIRKRRQSSKTAYGFAF